RDHARQLAAHLQACAAGLRTVERVRFGLIGTGTRGNVHAETYASHYRASLAAVCDVDEARARRARDRWSADRVYTDYREMLRDPNIDSVAVATLDFAHREPIVAAARASKHIIVEKPLATTREDLDQIAEALTKAGVKFMVDFHCRWASPLV